MLWPNGSLTRPTISSRFGPRAAPVAGASTFHRGTDFIGFSTIRAIAAGRVIAVGTPAGWSGGGVQVWIDHGGFVSRSLHMVAGSPVVSVGQYVAEGQALGQMGRTGNVSGVHLHLEIVTSGMQVDPLDFIQVRIAAAHGLTISVPEEDDMAYPFETTNGHRFLLAPGFAKHHIDVEASELNKNIVAANDLWIKVDLAQLEKQLDSFGIPRWVVDGNEGGVLDPGVGRPIRGGMWSWARDASVKADKILAALTAKAK